MVESPVDEAPYSEIEAGAAMEALSACDVVGVRIVRGVLPLRDE